MTCPKCKGKVVSIDSSINNTDNEVYRKKKCRDCGETFYTVEFEVIENDRFKKAWNANHR